MPDPEKTTMRWLALGLGMATAWVLAPFCGTLVLAIWMADLLQPTVLWLQRKLGGARRGAAAIVVLFAVSVLAPIAAALMAVAVGVRDLFFQVTAAFTGGVPLRPVFRGIDGAAAKPTLREWADLASRYGSNAWRAVTAVVQTSASVALAAVVFVAALYAFAASGRHSYRWFARNLPLPPRCFARLTRAFRETGRGLIVSGAGTALIQGLVATVTYVSIGVPRALLLGPLTAVCAFVPFIGTGLVWIPLAVELAWAGDYVRAGAVVVVGAGVHSLIDNFVRPMLTRFGRLQLPASVVLISMLGGIAVLGAPGALLGPLTVRLTVEALAITRERKLFR